MARYAQHLAGRNYGKLGIAIDSAPKLTIHGFETTHALNRAVGRDITTAERLMTVRDPVVVLSQRDGRQYLFLSERGVVVLTAEGYLVTTYGVSDFDGKIHAILAEAGVS